MERALKTLLAGVIDYAGLFPPAKLLMEPAVEEYLGHRDGLDSWIVDRYACPALHLSELADELEKHELKESVSVAVIGTSGKDKHHWDTALKQDEAAMAAFRLRAVNRGIIEAYEVRLPDNHHTEDCLRRLEPVDVNELFVEAPWTEGMEESIACIAGAEFAYAKARTGGATAESFPSVCELAAFIQQCAQLEVPMKLTAGLHHPLPHKDPVTGF